MFPRLRPEQHSGKTILRPVDYSGAIPKIVSTTVFHPPSVNIVQPLECLVDDEAQSIVGMKALTTSELRQRLARFAADVLENERRRIAE